MVRTVIEHYFYFLAEAPPACCCMQFRRPNTGLAPALRPLLEKGRHSRPPISPHQSEDVAVARHDVKPLVQQQVA